MEPGRLVFSFRNFLVALTPEQKSKLIQIINIIIPSRDGDTKKKANYQQVFYLCGYEIGAIAGCSSLSLMGTQTHPHVGR